MSKQGETTRTTIARTSFNGGLIGPTMMGRSDLAKYRDSCSELKNFIPLTTGAVQKRTGSMFLHQCNTLNSTRLFTFKFNEDQNFIIEAGHEYFRFHADGGTLMTTIGGTTPYEIVTTINEAWLDKINTIQQGDHIFFFSSDLLPHELVRITNNNWTWTALNFNGLGAWGNNPTAMCFYENRLWLGGSTNNPQGLAASKTADYFNFTIPGVLIDDSPLRFTINSQNNNRIQWFHSGKDLIVGTTGDEFVVNDGNGQGITPFNISVKAYTSYGSNHIPPVKIDNKLMFVQTGARVIRDFEYYLGSDSYEAIDVTILVEHLTESGIKKMVYQQSPHNILWILMNDGRLAGLTFNKKHKVEAWFEVETQGEYESIAVVPSWTDDRNDVLFFVVNRKDIHQNIEYFTPYKFLNNLNFTSNQNFDSLFLDSSLTYFNSTTATNYLSGLQHLANQQVIVFADNNVIRNETVNNNGELFFEGGGYLKIIVGLSYKCVLTTTPLEIGDSKNTTQGFKSKVVSSIFRLNEAGISFDYSMVNNEPLVADEWFIENIFKYVLNPPRDLFTGDTDDLKFIGSSQSKIQLRVRQDLPVSLSLLAMFITVELVSL